MNNICQPSLRFKNVHHITEDLLLNNIEINLKMFLDWAFLNIGGWFDVNINESNLQNNNYDKLILVNDRAYANGKVWEGIRKDWVWETASCNSRSPNGVSVSINNSTISSANYSINYPLGRIIFNNPQSQTSVVKCSYSYRYVQVYRANDSDWFSLIQYSGPSTTSNINKLANGNWSIGKQHIIQLPMIVVEALPKSRSRPHEIGSGGLIIEQDFAFHIFADNKNDRNKIIDILRLQQDLIIWLFDTNAIMKDNKYPLNYDGSLKTNPLNYPDIIDQYKWKQCWMRNISVFDVESVDPAMHRGIVRMTAEIIYT
jgi:hypothetical protein